MYSARDTVLLSADFLLQYIYILYTIYDCLARTYKFNVLEKARWSDTSIWVWFRFPKAVSFWMAGIKLDKSTFVTGQDRNRVIYIYFDKIT